MGRGHAQVFQVNSIKRNFPFYLFIVLLLAAFAFFFFQGKKQNDAKRKTHSPKEMIDSSHDQRLQKFTLTGFDDKGQKFWNLQGESAKIDAGQTIYLDENVTLRLRDNTVVRTDHVQWSQGGGTMRTNSPVFVSHETVKVKGMGAVGRPSDSFIQLNRQIEICRRAGLPGYVLYNYDERLKTRFLNEVAN